MELWPVGDARDRLQAHRFRNETTGGPRSVVAGTDAESSRRMPRRAARCRAPALHPLYLWNDRQAEGSGAHNGGLLDWNLNHNQVGFRFEGKRKLLVHCRYRLGEQAQLYGLPTPIKSREPAH